MSIELQLHVVVLKGNIETRRAHPAISDCSHLLLKCRMATNISQWLKVQSRWFKNYIFVKKCILISCWIFSTDGCQQFRSWSGPTLCWVWSGSNLFAKVISRQQKSPLAGKGINTKQPVDNTFCLKPWLKLISFGSNFFHLARVLDTTNSESGLALNSGKWLTGPGPSCDGTFNHRHVRLPIEVNESGPTLGNIIIIAHLVILSSLFVWFDG